MLSRLLIATATLVMSASLAWAGSFAKFDQSAFDAAQKAGKSIVLHVHADWCPTCKAQQGPLNTLAAGPDFRDVVTMTIDFDAQAGVRKTFNVQKQSTIIAFKGGKEVGRATGETNPDAIEKLVRTAL